MWAPIAYETNVVMATHHYKDFGLLVARIADVVQPLGGDGN